jgi:hypothetical protein
MTIYDGTAFGAIDATAYIDGKPSDQWLRKKIENNVAFLYVDSPPVTVFRLGGPTLSNAAGPYHEDRGIASVEKSIFLAIPVYVDESTTEITIKINAITPIGPVQIGGEVSTLSGTIIGTLPAAELDADLDFDESYHTYTIPVRPRASGYVLAYLTIQSGTEPVLGNKYVASGTVNAKIGAAKLVTVALSGSSYVFDPTASPNSTGPASIALDVAALYNAESEGRTDILAFSDQGGSLYNLVTPQSAGIGFGGSMTNMGPSRLTFMQLRSYQIQVTRRYDLREQDLIFGVPERGIDNLRHANLVRQLRSRPRLIAAGPSGNRGPWRHSIQGDQASIWEHAFGGVSSSPQPVTPLIRTGAIEPLSDGEVEIVMLLKGACHNAMGEGTVDWELVLAVDNFLDSESITQTFPVKTTGTQGLWFIRSSAFDVVGWVPQIQKAIGGDAFIGEFFTCREGQMLTQDLGQLSLVKMRVPMPSTGASVGLDISVTAECTGNFEDLALEADPFRYQHLTCVAWAVYLYPEESA